MPSGISKARRNAVSTEPGQTQLTRTPVLASSTARERVNMTTPPFDAQ